MAELRSKSSVEDSKVALCNFSVFLKNLDDELLIWPWYIDDVAGNKGFDVGNSVADVRIKSSVGD